MFICTGNICRSAMAHAMLEKLSKEKNKDKDIEVYSCGVYAENRRCTYKRSNSSNARI